MKTYPAKFYKFLTQRPLKEGEDWDIQSDEFEDKLAQAYEEYKDYLDGLYLILKDLKSKGLENSKEYKDTFKEFVDLAPGIPKELSA